MKSKTKALGLAMYAIVIVAFLFAVFFQDAHAQEDPRKLIGEYQGRPIYVVLVGSDIEITFSENPVCAPPWDKYENCKHVDVNIQLDGIEPFKVKPITFKKAKK